MNEDKRLRLEAVREMLRADRMGRVAAGVSVLLSIDWEPDRVVVEDGHYGCESGCEYVRVCVRQFDQEEELYGFFGTLEFCDSEPLQRTVWSIADALGVPAMKRDWTCDDDPVPLPRPTEVADR